jgi:hypothetical protein
LVSLEESEMSDNSYALRTTFDAIRNATLAAALLGAAAVVARDPMFAVPIPMAQVAEALLLVLLSFFLQIVNVVHWAYEISDLNVNKYAFSIGGALFVLLLMHFYFAFGWAEIEKVKGLV